MTVTGTTTPRTPDAEEARRLLTARRCARAYLPTPVPEDTLQQVLELAATAPSSSNTQPWTVAVVSGAARDRLSEALLAELDAGRTSADYPPSPYLGAGVGRSQQTGALIYTTMGIARDERDRRAEVLRENLRFFGAPHVALLLVEPGSGPLVLHDIGLWTQNFLLALTGYGLSGVPQGYVGLHGGRAREVLGIEDRVMVHGISFGFPDPDAAVNRIRTPRAPLAETVRRFD